MEGSGRRSLRDKRPHDVVGQSEERRGNYPHLGERDRFLANLRGDPRFDALMARVKREWEAFEV